MSWQLDAPKERWAHFVVLSITWGIEDWIPCEDLHALICEPCQ